MSRGMARISLTPKRPTAAEVVVREGFICPICMQDLGTIDELQDHFESDHTEEDKTLLQQLKGLLGRIFRAHTVLAFKNTAVSLSGYAA